MTTPPQPPSGATPAPGATLTNLQKMRLIQETFDQVIRPGLQADGGDAELVDIDGDRVLVKRVAADDKTKGGIILPDTAKEKPREGVVVSVGNGKLLDNGSRQAVSVKKNDRVLFSSYAGSEIKLDGEELLILGEDEILAIIEN